MKIFLKIGGIIILISGAILLILSQLNWKNPGGPAYSTSIDEAQKRGVLVGIIKLQPNPFKINDSIIITLESGFIEKLWREGLYKETLPVKSESEGWNRIDLEIKEIKQFYQLNKNSKEKFPWSIGLNDTIYFTESGLSSLNLHYNPRRFNPDTATFNIYRGDRPYNWKNMSSIEKIGEINFKVDYIDK